MSIKFLGGITALLATVAPVAAAGAQGYSGQTQSYQAPPPGQGYDAPGTSRAPDPRYDDPRYNDGRDDAAPRYDDGYAAQPPAGYNGSAPPPPPPGYQAGGDYAVSSAADQRYQANVEGWAQANCVKSGGNAAAGAVIGGVLGALVGSGIGGRGNHTAGAVIGGAAGAVGGAAIGDASGNATSPGCPPGLTVRRSAPAFAYNGYDSPYYYDAPGWYQPWLFVGSRWTYRPYPYHTFYYRNYGWGRPGFYGRSGFYGRPGYGRGYGYGRGGYRGGRGRR